MTFLEFVCHKYLGPPTSCKGNGESQWPCPKCGHSRWHTMPHKPEFKDRFKCWRCDFRGDLFDLLRHFYPREDYGARLARVADLTEEFARQQAASRDTVPFSSGESGSKRPANGRNAYDRDPTDDVFSPAADEAIKDLLDCFPEALEPDVRWTTLRLCGKALAICSSYGLHPAGLSERCEYAAWMDEGIAKHVAECQDPAHCDDWPCRMARGERPLTPEEVRAGLYRVDGHSPKITSV
jgi:hypothetical protein